MKKIYILAFVIVSALLASGCVREEVRDNEGSNKGEVVFRVSLDGLTTKTTTPGEGAENTVSSLDFIIFESDGTFLYKWHVPAPTPTPAGYYEQTAKVSTIGGNTAILQKAKTLAIANYPGDESVFAGKTLAQVQALAMVADNGTTNAASTGKFIYALADASYQTLTTPSFVMTSTLGSFDKDADDHLVSEVTLRRVAAKVTLTLNYVYDPNDPEGTAITTPGPTMSNHSTTTLWMPMIGDNTRVYLDNGALDATLNGLAATPGGFRYADNHPSYDTNTTNPFYTYPLSWTAGSDRAPFIKIIQPWHYVTVDNDDSTHPVLDENVVELYYKVMFPGITMLESNTWYHPTVTLDVLGGEADDPVELTGIGMDILDWGDVPSTGAGSLEDINLEPAKYLVPEGHNFTTHNGQGVVINYTASSKPTISVNSIYKHVYTNDGTDKKYMYDKVESYPSSGVSDTYVALGNPGAWFTNTYDAGTRKGKLTLEHTLSGQFFETDGVTPKPNFAARPYFYKLTLSLAGVNDQEINITQYPPLSVEGQMSTGWVCVGGHVTEGLASHYRKWTSGESGNPSEKQVEAPYYVALRRFDNVTGGTNNNKSIGAVDTYRLLPAGTNQCQWRIIIHPSPSAGYYLVDPRTDISTNKTDDNDLYEYINQHPENSTTSISITDSPCLVGESSPIDGTVLEKNTFDKNLEIKGVKSYKPTKRIVEESPNENVANKLPGLAPEFMVASSYGKTTRVGYANAVVRCAAYQEDGYPAGRWRVPTEVEIEMALKLNEREAIPNLFNNNYWASSGRYYNTTTKKWVKPADARALLRSDSSNPIFVRCVYDTWYWGRNEVDELKTTNFRNPSDPDFTEKTQNPQYYWSGYRYSSKTFITE